MTPIFLLILSLFSSFFQEERTFDPSKFTLDGISCFQTTEEEIKKIYGDVALTETDYECGFFSNREQKKIFYELIYPKKTWIGNSQQGYQIDVIEFDPEGKTQLKYGDLIFSGKSTRKELEEYFGSKASPIQINEPKRIYLDHLAGSFEGRDDGFILYFGKEYLVAFQYSSPC